MSILSRALDYTRVAALEDRIIEQLRRSERKAADTGVQGIGVEIPQNEPLYAAAINNILRKHPELAVVKFHDTFCLARNTAFKNTVGSELYDFMGANGHLVKKV